eukprot:m.255774 g.255774  ORF g.255774 m.255774 type:complete len:136 (-) comp15507_c0_seq2:81-488(-)
MLGAQGCPGFYRHPQLHSNVSSTLSEHRTSAAVFCLLFDGTKCYTQWRDAPQTLLQDLLVQYLVLVSLLVSCARQLEALESLAVAARRVQAAHVYGWTDCSVGPLTHDSFPIPVLKERISDMSLTDLTREYQMCH